MKTLQEYLENNIEIVLTVFMLITGIAAIINIVSFFLNL